MLEADKLSLFEYTVSPAASPCLYSPQISVCEGHSPCKRGWAPPEEPEEGNLCGQTKGGGMGWGWSLAQSSCMIPVAVETRAFAVPITSLYIPESHLLCVAWGGAWHGSHQLGACAARGKCRQKLQLWAGKEIMNHPFMQGHIATSQCHAVRLREKKGREW